VFFQPLPTHPTAFLELFYATIRLSVKRRTDMYCTNCGTPNKDDEEFCIHCGESLAEPKIKKKPFWERMLKKVGPLRALFDFSFNALFTPKIVKFLYMLSLLYAGLLTILCIIVGFNVSKGFGIFMIIIGAPLVLLLNVFYSRVLLEMVQMTLRMTHHTAELIKKVDSKDGIQWNT
jgi:hypothetical protein